MATILEDTVSPASPRPG